MYFVRANTLPHLDRCRFAFVAVNLCYHLSQAVVAFATMPPNLTLRFTFFHFITCFFFFHIYFMRAHINGEFIIVAREPKVQNPTVMEKMKRQQQQQQQL